MTDIKPRYDEDGVPWCVDTCPQHKDWIGCKLDDDYPAKGCRVFRVHSACPHAAKELAKDRARLDWLGENTYRAILNDTTPSGDQMEIEYEDIRAAIDKAMEE